MYYKRADNFNSSSCYHYYLYYYDDPSTIFISLATILCSMYVYYQYYITRLGALCSTWWAITKGGDIYSSSAALMVNQLTDNKILTPVKNVSSLGGVVCFQLGGLRLLPPNSYITVVLCSSISRSIVSLKLLFVFPLIFLAAAALSIVYIIISWDVPQVQLSARIEYLSNNYECSSKNTNGYSSPSLW